MLGYNHLLQRVLVRSWLTLLQVTACRLAATNPYLKHCSSQRFKGRNLEKIFMEILLRNGYFKNDL